MKSKKRKQLFLLIILVSLLFIINYPLLDNALERFLQDRETVFVERVIDGDTLVIENKTSVRLLGINSPEKGEIYSKEAQEFLEMITLNKTVELEFGKDKYDIYNRVLGYIFVNGKNVNLELVDEGYANFYFPSGRDVYYNKFVRAWEHCIGNNKNLCEKSKDTCANCIELKEFDYKNQIVVFSNNCSFDCELSGWEIKDEGRKKFIFPEFVLGNKNEVKINVGEESDNENVLFWKNEEYVWTKTGDTLFLRDEKKGLVLWESY